MPSSPASSVSKPQSQTNAPYSILHRGRGGCPTLGFLEGGVFNVGKPGITLPVELFVKLILTKIQCWEKTCNSDRSCQCFRCSPNKQLVSSWRHLASVDGLSEQHFFVPHQKTKRRLICISRR